MVIRRTLIGLFCGIPFVTSYGQGFCDVTEQALLNPSFELQADGSAFTAPIAKTITTLYGWTVPTPQEQSIANATSREVGFTSDKGGVVPSNGSFFFWNRKGWGSASGSLSTTTRTLEAGKYYVVFDYKAADYSNNNNQSNNGTTLQLVVSSTDGTVLVSATEARRSYSVANNGANPGADTYMKDSPWVPMGTMFTMPSDGKAVITVNQKLVNSGRSDVCYDNFRLYRVYDSGGSNITSFPLDITGTLANPSFEAGASGDSWQKYSYNGWTVAKTDGDILATSGESFVSVYGQQLHGLRIFNAWDGSATTSKRLSQTVSGLPIGKYRLSATVTGYTGNQFALFAGKTTQQVTVENQDAVQTVTLDFEKGNTSDLEVGIDATVFFKADNFRLEYLGYDDDIQEDESDQIKKAVTVKTAVDYTISSATPFAEEGSIDLCNDQATIIFTALKPSSVISSWLSYVKINGNAAVNGSNCQVRMYNNGAIILPYGDNCHPLTVYDGDNQTGASSSDFGLENSGGYMNTMSSSQLNNRVRSFRLKRGYMVTFSLQPEGRGYSRCFIADKSDLLVNLPPLMSGRVSSYRVFKWNSASKKGVASTTDRSVINKVNAKWCYTWNVGEDMGPDVECVPNHLYEDWPSSAACGNATWSPHLKTNNEPLNPQDDHPQTLNDILNNWQNLMRTGLRLCSPSSWDGSPSFMKEFLDAIDARGWRCDIVDLHCYWTEDQYNNLASLHNQYKRPLWISEFLWGASWNNNGIFASKKTDENRTVMGRILDRMNGWDYVERYAYWNSDQWFSRIVNTDDGWVTPLGEYYRDMDTGTGYNAANEYVPTAPPQSDPSNLKGNANVSAGTVKLTWHDDNGELNRSMAIERLDGSSWKQVYAVTSLADGASDYSSEVTGVMGDQFRVCVVDYNGGSRYSNVLTVPVTIASEGVPAMQVTFNGKTLYLGGNMIQNGDFDYGLLNWNGGDGNAATWPSFKVHDVAGIDNGAHIQAYTNQGAGEAGSLSRRVDITKNADYFFSVYSKGNGGGWQRASVSADGSEETTVVNTLSQTVDWTLDGTMFNAGTNPYFQIRYRWLGSKPQFDRFYLGRLFTNRADAVADAVAQIRKEIDLFYTWNSKYPSLNSELRQISSNNNGSDEQTLKTLQQALHSAYIAIRDAATVDSLLSVAAAVSSYDFAGLDALQDAVSQASAANNAADYASQKQLLKSALDDYMPVFNRSSLIESPMFDTTSGWTVKSGTYQGGDQKQNTWIGRTCWNAWWNVSTSEAAGATLGVSQTVSNLPMGYYSVSADAATEHYCLSDQHVSITNKSSQISAMSPSLSFDRADIPGVATADLWQTLRSLPVYVDEEGSVNISFTSSKAGAVDGAWGSGNREGWWLATDFRIYYTPAYCHQVTPQSWAVVCLPFASLPAYGLKVYAMEEDADGNVTLGDEVLGGMDAATPYIIYTESGDLVFRGVDDTRTATSLPLCQVIDDPTIKPEPEPETPEDPDDPENPEPDGISGVEADSSNAVFYDLQGRRVKMNNGGHRRTIVLGKGKKKYSVK